MASGCTITLPWDRPQARASLNPRAATTASSTLFIQTPPGNNNSIISTMELLQGVILKGQDKELHYIGINTTEFPTLLLKVCTSLPCPPKQSSSGTQGPTYQAWGAGPAPWLTASSPSLPVISLPCPVAFCAKLRHPNLEINEKTVSNKIFF